MPVHIRLTPEDPEPVGAFPLARAVLCVNCETVFDITNRTSCPRCCSSSYLNIALALGNEEARSRVRQLGVVR